MTNKCPDEVDLLLFAVSADNAKNIIARHVDECVSCRQKISQLSEVIAALTITSGPTASGMDCLDDVMIARLAEAVDLKSDARSIAHLAGCQRCREQLAGVVKLLGDPAIRAEVARLEPHAAGRRARLWPAAAIAGLVAAGLAGVLLMPVLEQRQDVPLDSAISRDGTVTTTVAPRIVAPFGTVSIQDSLRWTSVPRADLYRITVWDTAGTVLFQADSRDTTLAVPTQVLTATGTLRLWKVEARTGWDRWVASELKEFTVRAPQRSR